MRSEDEFGDAATDGCVLVARPDDPFASSLVAAVKEAGRDPVVAHNVSAAQKLIEAGAVADAILDIELDGKSCLPLIRRLREINSDTRVVVVTCQPSIATAVTAIKLGALDFLPVPIDARDVVLALNGNGARRRSDYVQPPLSVDRIEWEHINWVLTIHRGNISEAARQLGMHRRTLQRKLQKPPLLQ